MTVNSLRRRFVLGAFCAFGILLGTASPALALWPYQQRCYQLEMWKSPGAQSYSYAVPSDFYGNKTNFTMILVSGDVFKLMDWEGHFLTTNGVSLFPTRDWRGDNSSWFWADFATGTGHLRSVAFPDRSVGNAGGFLDVLAFADYQRHNLFGPGGTIGPHTFASMEAGACAPFNLPTPAPFTWVEDSPTPLLRLLQTQQFIVPGWLEVGWGDGTPLVNVFSLSGANPGVSPFTQTRLVPNADYCSYGNVVIGWPPGQCIFTDRHVYENPGNYTVRVILGSESDTRYHGVYVDIPVTILPKVAEFNVLSIGDSFASGEGAPTWTSSPNTDPADWWLRQTFGYPLDSAVWEARFPLESPEDVEEMHRSYYAGPALATQMLQEEEREVAVRLQHLAWSGATVGAVSDDSMRTLMGQLLVAHQQIEPYDVILMNGGGNDLRMAPFVQDCATGAVPCAVGEAQLTELAALPAKYDALATRIAASPITSQAHVIVTGLPDDLFSTLLGVCAISAPDVIGIEDSEEIAIRYLLLSVNAIISSKATQHGWTFVPVDFTGHGLCAPTGERWLNTVLDSFFLQASRADSDLFGLIFNGITLANILNGDFFTTPRDWDTLFNMKSVQGAFHPNYGGHRHYAERILVPLREALERKLAPPDTTPPTLTSVADLMVPATSSTGAVVNYAPPTASDDVDPSPVVSCAPPAGSTLPIGMTTVTCTARDAAGNTATGSFTVTVSNNLPTFTPPANISRATTNPAGVAVSFTALGHDIEDGSLPAVCAPTSGSIFPIGTTTVSCSVTDSRGLSASGSFTVSVAFSTKNKAPKVRGLMNYRVRATSPAGATVSFNVWGTDLEDGLLPATCSHPSGEVFPIGKTTVSCVTTDSMGATRTGVFRISVVANEPPRLRGLADIKMGAQSATGTPIVFHVTGIDQEDGVLPATCSRVSGDIFPIGKTTVTCSTTDSNGATKTDSFGVRIEP